MWDKYSFRYKLSVLWIFQAVGFSAYTTLDTVRPGIFEEMMSGTYEGIPLTEGVFIYFSLIWLITLIMAYLSLILKGSIFRWTNIILGIIWVVLWIIDTIEGGLLLAQYLLNFSMILAAALIAWNAWNWSKQKNKIDSIFFSHILLNYLARARIFFIS